MKTTTGLVVMAALAVVLVASDSFAQLEPLKDNNGIIIGYLEKRTDRTFVKDRCQIILGYVTEKGTFTETGIRMAQSPLPYMLLQRDKNCANKRRSCGQGVR